MATRAEGVPLAPFRVVVDGAMSDEQVRQTFVTVFAVAGTLAVILIFAYLVVWTARHRG